MVKICKIISFTLFTALWIFSAGCGKTFKVQQYPVFYNPDIRQVAVLPFENQTNTRGVGLLVADNLTAALVANGTYQVTGPRQLREFLKTSKIQPSTPNAQTAQDLAAKNYQAFITGRVLRQSDIIQIQNLWYNEPYFGMWDYGFYDDDDFGEEEEGDDDPDPPFPYGYYYSNWYYPYYYEYDSAAYIAATASVVSVPQGSVLFSTTAEASADVPGGSRHARRSALQAALKKLSTRLVDELAVVPVKIKVYQDKDLKTADRQINGKWNFVNTFSENEESMYVVLCLPAQAAYNDFVLWIVPEHESYQPIIEKRIQWPTGRYCNSFEFSPREIAAQNGPGHYSVLFKYQGKTIMARNFKIE